jgi:hypothetical protein
VRLGFVPFVQRRFIRQKRRLDPLPIFRPPNQSDLEPTVRFVLYSARDTSLTCLQKSYAAPKTFAIGFALPLN